MCSNMKIPEIQKSGNTETTCVCYVCIFVWMYVSMFVGRQIWLYISECMSMYACMLISRHAWGYAFVFLCKYIERQDGERHAWVCMYAWINVYIYMKS